MSTKKKILISHAAKDKSLADQIVDRLLNNGCDVPVSEIFCTSLEGSPIPPGSKNFIEVIRQNIQDPSLVILLLTENYFCSTFCQCELGATWAMDLPTFPLVVAPINKATLKATLAVTQAGDIDNASYLDELRDAVKACHGSEVKTARWNVKRDLFLKELPQVLAKLPKPTQVPADKLLEAEQKYDEALKELEADEEKISALNAQIAELKKCKDAVQVKAVTQKYSTSEKEFGGLQQKAQRALEKLQRATRVTLFRELRGDGYFPEGDEEWRDATAAEAVEQVKIHHGENSVASRDDHPRVREAEAALRELKNFLQDEKHANFVIGLEKEQKFPISVSNKDFWNAFLANI